MIGGSCDDGGGADCAAFRSRTWLAYKRNRGIGKDAGIVAPSNPAVSISYVDGLVNNANDNDERMFDTESEMQEYCSLFTACLGYYRANGKFRGLASMSSNRANFWRTRADIGITVRKKVSTPVAAQSYIDAPRSAALNNADDSREPVYSSEAEAQSNCSQRTTCLGYYHNPANNKWRLLKAGSRVNFWYTGNHQLTVRKKL